jgi:putative DNA primase/helicase
MNHINKTPGGLGGTHPGVNELQVNHNTKVNQIGVNPITPMEWALFYAQIGWSVFPVHSIKNSSCTCKKADCTKSGKHPRTTHGFNDATNNIEQIKIWWTRWPDANIGVATGKKSGIVVLDIDKKTQGFESIKKLEGEFGNLPKVLTVNTGGGGLHLYFKYPENGFKSTEGVLGAGIDTRGDGGYIIAPPSNHISGGQYTWKE